MYKVTVSIVVYGPDIVFLGKVINSLMKDPALSKVILVDNSPQPLKGFCIDRYNGRLEYVYNGKNIGFASAHNIAINKIINSSKYHLILNPDVYFEGDLISKICAYMDRNEDVGMLIPKILYPDGSTQFLCKLLPTPFDLIFRRFVPFKKILENRTRVYELRFTGYNAIMNVPSLSGCFMFTRTSVLKEVEGFDERYFLYMEDIDLCRRVHSKYKTVFYPEVTAYHVYEKGSYKNIKLLRYHFVSAIKYFNKWGWIFDKYRRDINKKTLKDLKYSGR